MKYKLKPFFLLLMVLSLLFVSACADTTDEAPDEHGEDVQEIEMAVELKTLDDLTAVDSQWLAPFDYDAVDPETRIEENKKKVAFEEQIVEEIFADMDEHDIDHKNLILRHYEDDFYVLLDTKTGKVYRYDQGEGALIPLLDATEMPSLDMEYFLLARSKGDRLYLANSDKLYVFHRVEEPNVIRVAPDDFQFIELGKNYALLQHENEAYVYLFDTEKIAYIIPEAYVGFEYDDYLITKVEDMIYAFDFTHGKQYIQQVDYVDKDMIVFPESDKLALVDWDDQSELPIEWTINLPELP